MKKNELTTDITAEAFEIKEPHYHFRYAAFHFKKENIKSTHYGIQSVWY